MQDKIKRWLYDVEKSDDLQKYISIPVENINEQLKMKIAELEVAGEILAKKFQHQYAAQFEERNKRNFSIWVSRDMDGDEINRLTAASCLEKEYRSRIAINYNDPGDDNDCYAAAITLWHYHSVFLKSFGTLYDADKNDLEKDIKETLGKLLD